MTRILYQQGRSKVVLVGVIFGLVMFMGLWPLVELEETEFAPRSFSLHVPECDGSLDARRMDEIKSCLDKGVCPWQPAFGSADAFRVFSAYLDERFEEPFVRVIGAANLRMAEQEDVWCLYPTLNEGFSNKTIWRSFKAKLNIMGDHHNETYTGVFVMCPLRADVSVPEFVSISIGALNPSLPSGLEIICATGNILSVNGRSVAGSKPIVEFGACIKVLHNDIPPAKEIVEFVEFSRLLGVDHFTFYNDTLNPFSQNEKHIQSSCALRCYKNQGLVEVVQFGLDLAPIHVKGQVVSTNDCIYRQRHHYRHHVNVDTDEFIVPRIGELLTYQELLPAIRGALNISEENVREYSFRNAFFPQECRGDKDRYRHQTMLREQYIWPYQRRSKYISVADRIIEAYPHYTSQGFGEILPVSPDMAILHHYREFQKGILGARDCSAFLEDLTVKRYEKALLRAINSFLDRCEDMCGRLF